MNEEKVLVMDFNQMFSIARHSEYSEMLPAKSYSLDEKYSNLVVNVNLSLATLFNKIRNKASKSELLDSYCMTMRDFFAIANFKEWTYIMLMSDEDLNAIGQKWKSESLAMVYLSIQQQINSCYFKRQPQSLVHAWHMFLKLGLIDLDFDENQIESHFEKMFMK